MFKRCKYTLCNIPWVDKFEGTLKVLAFETMVLLVSSNDLLGVFVVGVSVLETWVTECDAPKLSRKVLIISRYCFCSSRHALRRLGKLSSLVPNVNSPPTCKKAKEIYSIIQILYCAIYFVLQLIRWDACLSVYLYSFDPTVGWCGIEKKKTNTDTGQKYR